MDCTGLGEEKKKERENREGEKPVEIRTTSVVWVWLRYKPGNLRFQVKSLVLVMMFLNYVCRDLTLSSIQESECGECLKNFLNKQHRFGWYHQGGFNTLAIIQQSDIKEYTDTFNLLSHLTSKQSHTISIVILVLEIRNMREND